MCVCRIPSYFIENTAGGSLEDNRNVNYFRWITYTAQPFPFLLHRALSVSRSVVSSHCQMQKKPDMLDARPFAFGKKLNLTASGRQTRRHPLVAQQQHFSNCYLKVLGLGAALYHQK